MTLKSGLRKRSTRFGSWKSCKQDTYTRVVWGRGFEAEVKTRVFRNTEDVSVKITLFELLFPLPPDRQTVSQTPNER